MQPSTESPKTTGGVVLRYSAARGAGVRWPVPRPELRETTTVSSQEGLVDRFVRFWWVWAIVALIVGAITTAAAQGFPIVDLELAGTVARADDVIRGADLDAIRSAILWDFVFLALYAPALFFGCVWASRQYTSARWRSVGTTIGIGALIAGGLDIVENLAMLGYLNSWGGWDGWPMLSTVMAVPKFILVLIALVYILIGMTISSAAWLSQRRSRNES